MNAFELVQYKAEAQRVAEKAPAPPIVAMQQKKPGRPKGSKNPPKVNK